MAAWQVAMMTDGPGKTIGTFAWMIHVPLEAAVTRVAPLDSKRVSMASPPVLK